MHVTHKDVSLGSPNRFQLSMGWSAYGQSMHDRHGEMPVNLKHRLTREESHEVLAKLQIHEIRARFRFVCKLYLHLRGLTT